MYSSSPSSSGRSAGEEATKGYVATANAMRGSGCQGILSIAHWEECGTRYAAQTSKGMLVINRRKSASSGEKLFFFSFLFVLYC